MQALVGNGGLLQIVLYNLVGQLLGAALQPLTQNIANIVWPQDPVVPLSPADAAAAVVRGEFTEDQAAAEALLSGVNRERLHTMVRLTGDAPAPEALAVALRRGFIDQGRYEQGIAQGRMRTEWGELIRQLSVEQPSPLEPLEALLEGQITEAQAKALYAAFGGDPRYFQWRFDSRGSAPTPDQAAEMARRGIIPWTGTGAGVVSYDQAFLEGPWRNKWSEAFKATAVYLPPPRTISAMVKEGVLTHERAASLLAQQGVPQDLVEAYLASGSAQKTQPTKDLTQATILTLYRDRLVTADVAGTMLGALGFDPDEAGFLLAAEDFRIQQQFLSLAVNRVHALYVGHKIAKGQATSALTSLGVDATAQTDILTTWDLERSVNVRPLTAAEIARAFHFSLIKSPEALAMLEQLGFSSRDAWLYLAVHNGGNVDAVKTPPGADTPPAAQQGA